MRKIAVLMAALGLAAVLNGCGSGLTQSQQVLEMEKAIYGGACR